MPAVVALVASTSVGLIVPEPRPGRFRWRDDGCGPLIGLFYLRLLAVGVRRRGAVVLLFLRWLGGWTTPPTRARDRHRGPCYRLDLALVVFGVLRSGTWD
jgi:hypothetical protein